jgi:hypothetical protein
MQKLPRLFTHCIDGHNQRNMNLSFVIIQGKAMYLFKNLKLRAEEGVAHVEDLEFKASHGWCERLLKTRANLRSLCTSDKQALM